MQPQPGLLALWKIYHVPRGDRGEGDQILPILNFDLNFKERSHRNDCSLVKFVWQAIFKEKF